MGLDNEMSSFRAITAEEEASSGLMRSLMDLGYPESDKMKVHDHVHKHAVFPYLKIVGLFLGQSLVSTFKNYTLHIQEIEGARRLTLALPIRVGLEDKLVYPQPPLHFFVSEAGSGMSPMFKKQMEEFLVAHGRSTIRSFLKEEANIRNTLLYADPNGYPDMKNMDVSFILARRERVMAMIQVFLLIYPYENHQAFVTHAISVFVELLEKVGRRKPKKDIA